MSKGNDKKPKASQEKPKGGGSPYKIAQSQDKKATNPFARKLTAIPAGRKGT